MKLLTGHTVCRHGKTAYGWVRSFKHIPENQNDHHVDGIVIRLGVCLLHERWSENDVSPVAAMSASDTGAVTAESDTESSSLDITGEGIFFAISLST